MSSNQWDLVLARLWPIRSVLRGIAKRIDDGFVERRLGFLLLRCRVGCEEILFLPELAADGGERIGEGGLRLAIPSSGRDRLAGFGVEAGGEQPSAKTARAGTGWCERWPGPTTGAGSRPRGGRGSRGPSIGSGVTSTCQRRTYQVTW
jgi:hypothetical protein